MSNKSGFTLVQPTTPLLKKQTTTFSICGGAGGQDITVADLNALLVAEGLTSPNGNATPVIVRSEIGTAPKGRPTSDQQTDTIITATGETVTITENGNDTLVHGGETEFHEVCLLDENCDLVPDEVLDPAISYNIPADSCVKFAVDYA